MNPNSSPYQSPMPYYFAASPPDLSGPSRRAGLLMIILGVLTLLLSVVVVGMSMVVQAGKLPPDVQAQMQRIETEVGVSAATFIKIAAVIIAVPGLLMIVLGLFVRRGGMASAVLGVILTALILLYLIASLVQTVLTGIQSNPASAVMPICFSGVAIGLFGLQIIWLAKATINAGPLKAFNQQQQAYAWQMQQQMYAQQQQQYQMPPPPPPQK